MYYVEKAGEASPAQRFEELVRATVVRNNELSEKVVGLPEMPLEDLEEHLSPIEVFRLRVERMEHSLRLQAYHLPRIKEKAQEGQHTFLERYGDLWNIAQGLETPVIDLLNSERGEEFAEWLLGRHEFIQKSLLATYLLETGRIDYLLTLPWQTLLPAAPTIEDKMLDHRTIGSHLLGLATQQGLTSLAEQDQLAPEHRFKALFPTVDPGTNHEAVGILLDVEKPEPHIVQERWSVYYAREERLFREIYQSEYDFSNDTENANHVIIDMLGSRSRHVINLLEAVLQAYVDFDHMDVGALKARVRESIQQEDEEATD